MDDLKPATTSENEVVNESVQVSADDTPSTSSEQVVQPDPVEVEKSRKMLLVEEAKIAAANSDSGARWFYWIAGLSVVNTLISFFKGDVSFIIGLGATQIGDALVSQLETVVFGWFIIVLVTVFYFLMGYFSLQHKKWAFITGMICYFIDALIFLTVSDFWSIGFHAYALFNIFVGFKACQQYNKLNAELAAEGFNLKEYLKEKK